MSELTPCNFCTMKRLIRENLGKTVCVKAEGNWLRVFVEDKAIGVAFQALTLECVC